MHYRLELLLLFVVSGKHFMENSAVERMRHNSLVLATQIVLGRSNQINCRNVCFVLLDRKFHREWKVLFKEVISPKPID